MKEQEIVLEYGATEAYRYDDSVVIYWTNEEHPLYLSKKDLENMLRFFEGDKE